MGAKPMKAARAAGKPLTKGGIAQAVAEECELKKGIAGMMIASIAAIATKEVQQNGIFTFPGLCRIKTRQKPATKACKREIFGKMQTVKAKPADDRQGVPRGGFEEEHLNVNLRRDRRA